MDRSQVHRMNLTKNLKFNCGQNEEKKIINEYYCILSDYNIHASRVCLICDKKFLQNMKLCCGLFCISTITLWVLPTIKIISNHTYYKTHTWRTFNFFFQVFNSTNPTVVLSTFTNYITIEIAFLHIVYNFVWSSTK